MRKHDDVRNAIRRPRTAAAVLATVAMLATTAAPVAAPQRTSDRATAGAPERGVTGTRPQIFEAWLATDASVIGRYGGVDSTLGPRYHTVEVERVWAGSPARGRLVFKAPRGIRVRPGDRMLLHLWERLSGAPDSYLEEAKARWGERVWDAIGHDSLAAYLLPFATYAYPLDDDRLVLRGRGLFTDKIKVADLQRDFEAWGLEHAPQKLYAAATAVIRARVAEVAIVPRTQHGIVAEWRVQSRLDIVETYKGAVENPLAFEFISFPRSPRLLQGDEVILFLSRIESAWVLPAGKRDVFHVEGGAVVESGQPLSEFIKVMRGS